MKRDADKVLLGEIGHRIRITREAEGITLKQLALLSGISAPALSLIETAKRDARLTTLNRIAIALRTPLASLVEDKPSLEPDHREGESSGTEGYDLSKYVR